VRVLETEIELRESVLLKFGQGWAAGSLNKNLSPCSECLHHAPRLAFALNDTRLQLQAH